ncbi:YncE family protein [Streptomyces sp. NPDC058579]|uniref:YncE family protein n=1 Tax=Streptomyces sp. NPDC058579 TaxID=3346548 RepID=UPI003653A93C
MRRPLTLAAAVVVALTGTAAAAPAPSTGTATTTTTTTTNAQSTAPAPATHENVRTIRPPLGDALDAEVDPAADRLYVSSSDGTAHRLSTYDTATGALVGEPVALLAPATVLALGGSGRLYLGLSTRIAAYDPTSRTLTDDVIPVTGSVSLLAADPGQGRLYVGNQAAKSVTVYDTGTARAVADPVVLPFHPAGLAVDTVHHTGYATYVGGSMENGSVVYKNVLNTVDGTTGRLTGTVSLGSTALGSMGVAVDPTTRTGYVANLAAGTVSAVDLTAQQVKGTIPVEGNPKALAYDPGTKTLYAARTGASAVAVVDPERATVTETITTGERPSALTLDTESHTLYTVAGGAVTQTQRRTPTPEPTPTPTTPTDPTPTPTATTEPTPTPTKPTAPTESTTSVPSTTTPPATGTVGGGDSPGAQATNTLAATGGAVLPTALAATALAVLGGATVLLTRLRTRRNAERP